MIVFDDPPPDKACPCMECRLKRGEVASAERELDQHRARLTPEARETMDWLVAGYRSWPNQLADGRRA